MSQPTPGPPSRATLLSTASAFLTSYNRWTISDIISIRSPSCVHYTLPATLEVPPRDNASYATFMGPMLSIFRGVEFSIIDDKETVVDVEARRVVMHCQNNADTDAGHYTNEYMFTLTISDDGKKVDQIVEFIDAAYTVDFKQRIALARGPTKPDGRE